MSEETKDFVIKDRRVFADGTEEGRKDGEPEAAPDGGQDKGKAEDKKDAGKSETKASDRKNTEDIPLPEINFSTFVFSLNSSALVQLGVIDDPASGQQSKNLVLAKQTIDILSMLEEKTKGNLTQEEENLLKSLLYGLRMTYVKELG